MLDEKALDDIFDKIGALSGAPPEVIDHLIPMAGRDEATGPVREIRCGEKWFVVSEALWNGWTGLRRVNGEEHHGPVSYLDSPPGEKIAYRGKRTCGCRKCEESVPPSLRKN